MARSWNGMAWNNEWRHLKWHRDILKLAPFSIGGGRARAQAWASARASIIDQIMDQNTSQEAKDTWLADLWRSVGTGEVLLYSVLSAMATTESMYQHQQWIHAIHPIYWSIRARRLGMDPVCLLGLDHACMHGNLPASWWVYTCRVSGCLLVYSVEAMTRLDSSSARNNDILAFRSFPRFFCPQRSI